VPHILRRIPRGEIARNNMAVRILPGGGIEFDTPEEAIAYQRASSKKGAASLPARAPARGSAYAETAADRADLARRAQRIIQRDIVIADPDSAVTYGQAGVLMRAMGGQLNFCPNLVPSAKDARRLSNDQILAEMGVTKGAANQVISALKSEGLDGFNSDARRIARARAIFEELSGFSCPVPKKNPRAVRNRRW